MKNTKDLLTVVIPLLSSLITGVIGWIVRGYWDKRKEKQEIVGSAPYVYTQTLSVNEDKENINPGNLSKNCYYLRIEEKVDEQKREGIINANFTETTLDNIKIMGQMQYVFLSNKKHDGLETKFICKDQTVLLHNWQYRILGNEQSVSLFVPLFERPTQIMMDSREYEFYFDNQAPDGFFSGKFNYRVKKRKFREKPKNK